jgi:hypothetical protein
MDSRRRGIIAALLCSPAFLRAERIDETTTVELPANFTLKVTCQGKTIALTGEEIVFALDKPAVIDLPDDFATRSIWR